MPRRLCPARNARGGQGSGCTSRCGSRIITERETVNSTVVPGNGTSHRTKRGVSYLMHLWDCTARRRLHGKDADHRGDMQQKTF